MLTPEFDRKAFAWIFWIFVGICLIVLLTSCSLMPDVQQPVPEGPYWEISLTNGSQVQCQTINTSDAGVTCENFGESPSENDIQFYEKDKVGNIEYIDQAQTAVPVSTLAVMEQDISLSTMATEPAQQDLPAMSGEECAAAGAARGWSATWGPATDGCWVISPDGGQSERLGTWKE